jgi:hypothetical protein
VNAQVVPKIDTIDQRVELISIVYRLAGIEEYTVERYPDRVFTNYIDLIEDHFRKFENHEAVKYVKKTLKSKGIRYDAVMSFPICVTHPPNMTPVVEFSNNILERRWDVKAATKFLSLLNNFYEQTEFEDFYKKNQALYNTVKKRFALMTSKINQSWYSAFYGYEAKINFGVINALGIGPYNYNINLILPDGQKFAYAVIGAAYLDSLGLPIYDKYLNTILHEFNHSFVNPIVYNNEKVFKENGEKIYKRFKKMEIATNDAYGNWQSMLNESLVRAAVIKYYKDSGYDQQVIDERLELENKLGFPWIKELSEKLDYYGSNRNEYPNFESFVPELVIFFNQVNLEIDTYFSRVK